MVLFSHGEHKAFVHGTKIRLIGPYYLAFLSLAEDPKAHQESSWQCGRKNGSEEVEIFIAAPLDFVETLESVFFDKANIVHTFTAKCGSKLLVQRHQSQISYRYMGL